MKILKTKKKIHEAQEMEHEFSMQRRRMTSRAEVLFKKGHMADTRIIYQPIIVQTMRTGTVSYVGNQFYLWRLLGLDTDDSDIRFVI